MAAVSVGAAYFFGTLARVIQAEVHHFANVAIATHGLDDSERE